MLLFCILLNVAVAIIFKVFPRFNIDVKRAIIVNYFTCVATASRCHTGKIIDNNGSFNIDIKPRKNLKDDGNSHI